MTAIKDAPHTETTSRHSRLTATPAIAAPRGKSGLGADLVRLLPYLRPYRARWIAMLVGQGTLPASYDPMCDTIPPTDLDRALRGMRAAIVAAADAMPTQQAYLDANARAPTP